MLDNLEGGFIPDGEDEDVAVNARGVEHAELGVLVLAVGVEYGDVVMDTINDGVPQVGVLKSEGVVGLEPVLYDANSECRLAHTSGA